MAVLGAMVSACGGGGNGGDNSSAPQAPTNRLAGYVGNWSADCSDHAMDSATITSPSANVLTIKTRTDYYAGSNCTGAIIATQTDSADVTATYVDSVDSSVVFTKGAAATPTKVDRITASLPQHTTSVTGTGVNRVIQGGQAQWCIAFSGGNQTCVWDEGTYAAASGVSGGLFLQNNTLYELSPNGSQYVINDRFTRK